MRVLLAVAAHRGGRVAGAAGPGARAGQSRLRHARYRQRLVRLRRPPWPSCLRKTLPPGSKQSTFKPRAAASATRGWCQERRRPSAWSFTVTNRWAFEGKGPTPRSSRTSRSRGRPRHYYLVAMATKKLGIQLVRENP